MLLQWLCTIQCSARTCEIYEQKDIDSLSYIATNRGKPADGLYEHSLSMPAARKVILRMLSLAQSGILAIHSIQLAPAPDPYPHHDLLDNQDNLQHEKTTSSQSQQAEVKAMLQKLMSTGKDLC